jgi:hypothetical protein
MQRVSPILVESDTKTKPDDARSIDDGLLYRTKTQCFFGFLIHGVEGPFTYDIKLSILHTYAFQCTKSNPI